jgi:F0F1-type ATP synthase gamma subunit
MNFHSLLHIDAARRIAEKYIRMEAQITKIIDMIVNNRNFILDKHTLEVNQDAPPLNIYIGSDFSFCGAINALVNGAVLEDDDAEKIIVGKKLRTTAPGTLLTMTKEEFDEDFGPIERELEKSVYTLRNSSINVVYNHYYYAGKIALRRNRIFPIAMIEDTSIEDFTVEGDVDKLLRSLVSAYCGYEVKIAAVNSFASENIMRQSATTESLKKIDEMVAEKQLIERKEKRQKGFRKVLDSYVKKTVFGGSQE